MIKVDNISKVFRTSKDQGSLFKNIFQRKYTDVRAVENISFSIEPGEFVGFLGPNGAGKTTTMKMLAGILMPSTGKVEVAGYNPFNKEKDYLKNIAFVMGQRGNLMWDLPAMDSFMVTKVVYEIPDATFRTTLKELTRVLDVADLLDRPVKSLSLGQRMKMEAVAALLHRPKILFLDEPTIGLDVNAQKTIRDFIKSYQEQYNATILLTSHYMEDVKQLCKRVIIINKGTIIFDGPLSQLVKKYSQNKSIRVVVNKDYPAAMLAEYGTITLHEFPVVEFSVPISKVPDVMRRMSANIDYTDIVIEDTKIETIIGRIFNQPTEKKAK